MESAKSAHSHSFLLVFPSLFYVEFTCPSSISTSINMVIICSLIHQLDSISCHDYSLSRVRVVASVKWKFSVTSCWRNDTLSCKKIHDYVIILWDRNTLSWNVLERQILVTWLSLGRCQSHKECNIISMYFGPRYTKTT